MRKNNFIFIAIAAVFLLLSGCGSSYIQETESLANITAAAETTQSAAEDLSQGSGKADNPTNTESGLGLLTVSYIDVGQADSILITSPEGKNMLIDAGEGEGYKGSVLAYLDTKGIDTLDTVVATHPHSDHINAMDEVIAAKKISNFYMPNCVHTTKDFENMLNALDSKSYIKVIEAKAGMDFALGDSVKCSILAPVSESYDNLNNYSVVVKLTYGQASFLFMGDAETEVEEEILAGGADITANVLKCGHHGSSTSTSRNFLDAADPQYAVISCGKGNDYGHPHKETSEKLAAKGITVLRTDEMGTITLQSDSNNIITVAEASTEAATITAGEAAAETSAAASTAASAEAYIGNKNSKVYHRSDCKSLPKEENRIYLTREEAENNGYKPCKSCKP